MEQATYYRYYAMAAFLDIKDTFNNIRLDSILEALKSLRLEAGVFPWIGYCFDREINADLGEQLYYYVGKENNPTRGGGTPPSPLL